MSGWKITYMGEGIAQLDGIGNFQKHTTATVTEKVATGLKGDNRWQIVGPAGAPLASPAPAKAEEKKADPKAEKAPKVEEKKPDAPKAEEKKPDAPKADAPKADAPKADAPKA
jgi:hypothetical protein